MCLAVPVLLKQKRDDSGTIDLGGVEREVSLLLTPEAQEGDYVIVHAGFAISVLDREEAEATLSLFRELADSQGQ
ncbi:MAG: HypC/HybG/HupF family hydrogenase formation chaperone [Anaerolineae bacterium]|nr:HypC/HybG/HupF family hydrogenase formation chaperone [Anaerolineae bacterium]